MNQGKVYQAWRDEEKPVVVVDGKPLDAKPSQKIFNHSPDGFNWGYGGSGPSQLALGILYDYTGDEEIAKKWYQEFKWCFIANASPDGFQLNSSEIDEFLATRLHKV